jgi:hypothetical protein
MKSGRPKLEFRHDPDRYLLALAAVFRELGASRRGSIEIAVACLEGVVVGRNAKPGWGRGIGVLEVRYELWRRRDDAGDGIADRARWLRRKMKDGDSDEASRRWLAAMSGAWLIALHAGPVRIIRDLAQAVGEVAYAERMLVPIAMGRPPLLPGEEKAAVVNFRPQTS